MPHRTIPLGCSNYPVWFQNIEERLQLSRYLSWSFVSCEGPMRGLRKPSPESFSAVVQHLGVPPGELLLVDDRLPNVVGAVNTGMHAIHFTSAAQLEEELRKKGVLR